MKNNVLFYIIKPVTISNIDAEISEYTKSNGHYPDYIDMPSAVYSEYKLMYPSNIFGGIPVREREL